MALWGKTDTLADAPKYLETSADNTNKAHDKDNAVFVDVTEAGVPANRAKGLKTPGWNLYHTYTDGVTGLPRHKSEVLVAMKVSAADAGDLGVTGVGTQEDAKVKDGTLTITAQPLQVHATFDFAGNAPASLTITTSSTVTPGVGQELAYKWKVSTDGGTTFANSTSNGVTTDTLIISNGDADYVLGNQFYCIASQEGGVIEDVDSDIVTLTQDV